MNPREQFLAPEPEVVVIAETIYGSEIEVEYDRLDSDYHARVEIAYAGWLVRRARRGLRRVVSVPRRAVRRPQRPGRRRTRTTSRSAPGDDDPAGARAGVA